MQKKNPRLAGRYGVAARGRFCPGIGKRFYRHSGVGFHPDILDPDIRRRRET